MRKSLNNFCTESHDIKKIKLNVYVENNKLNKCSKLSSSKWTACAYWMRQKKKKVQVSESKKGKSIDWKIAQ